MDTPEFISFHDKLTGKYHTATWGEARQALLELQHALGRTPTRDELLAQVLENKEVL